MVEKIVTIYMWSIQFQIWKTFYFYVIYQISAAHSSDMGAVYLYSASSSNVYRRLLLTCTDMLKPSYTT